MVRAGVSASLRDFLRRYPAIDLDQLAAGVGIDPRRLGDADQVLDQRHWFALVEAAARLSGDDAFAIAYTAQLPWKDLGVLGYLARNSPTVRDAAENMARYFAIHQTLARLELVVGAREARFTHIIPDGVGPAPAPIVEGTFAVVVRLVREATAVAGWKPRAVDFRHQAPRSRAQHEAFFAAPLRFGARTNTIVFATEDLARRFVEADADLLPHLLRHARELLAQPMQPAATDEVRRAVVEAIAAGEPAIEKVAAHLGQSTRSLQRRLKLGGHSFSALVADVRHSLAGRYLADPSLSLTETALLLGYSDLSAFSRAYKRWTGHAPRESRQAPSARRAARTR